MERIFSACRDAKSPVPEIQLDGHDLWVEFPYSKTYMEKLQGDISSKNTAVKSSGKSSGKGSGKSSEVIITMLRNNKTMTIPELAEALSISTRAVEKNIQKLQNAGRLKRIGPAKGGYWDVLN